MGRVFRHALAVLVFPVTVVVIVPTWIAESSSTDLGLPQSVLAWVLFGFGIVVLMGGAVLFVSSLKRFGTEGDGTLAPWDPPKGLVVRGPYAYVRNPMISGVFLLLVSEALLLRSPSHLAWAAVFALINAIYIPLLEEPRLKARFGDEFEEYARHVPRVIPRLEPWRRS